MNNTNTEPDPAITQLVDVSGLAKALEVFAEERDWGQFHSPKNLAMALTGEVGELVEVFQWMTEEESRVAATNPVTAQPLREELADVSLYMVRLSLVLGADLESAARERMAKNSAKYSAALAHGSSKKYKAL